MFHKSLFRKTVVALFFSSVVITAGGYFAFLFFPTLQPIMLMVGIVFVATCIACLIVFRTIHSPLQKIFYEMKAFLAGRSYKKIFTARVDEVGVLAHFFNDITRNLERMKVAMAEGKRLSEEVSIGNDIQRKILPSLMPSPAGLRIYGNTRPSSEVGGDSFDIIPAGLNTFVYVGDVTGHGVPAALIMIMVNTLIRTYTELYPSGYDILMHTNRILKTRIEPRRFMTCVLLRWNEKDQQMFFTGAGHEHILIYRKQEQVCEVRQTGGIALGMVPDISKIIREESIPLQPRDSVVLYSDGIVEAKNIEGEMYGVARLQKSVIAHAGTAAPEELFIKLSKDFADFVGDQVQEDDMTLIVLQKQ